MTTAVQIIITIVCSILASSGLWTFIMKKTDNRDVRIKMLVGLAHDRIMALGMQYIERGWITREEYENIYEYLYKPYSELGGNGSAERIMKEINKLPIKSINYIMEDDTNVQ